MDIKELSEKEERGETIRYLEKQLQETMDENLLMQLGELLYAEGRTTDALNRFNAVLRLNPNNQKAANYATMILNILNYYNKDLLNP